MYNQHHSQKEIILKNLGIQNYQHVLNAMHQFNLKRTKKTKDEIWLLEHFPVFTQGRNGKNENILFKSPKIPIIQSDRGGQITFHAPGQKIMYIMIDIKRNNINIRKLINSLETTVIYTLLKFNIHAYSKMHAPGVYIKNKKICSIGLKIQNGYSLHGLAFNIKMDLKPFDYINPCGFKKMKMTQLSEFTNNFSIKKIDSLLIKKFCQLLNFKVLNNNT
ncbi:MAG: lipoyl(octanoyl) transferase LipB [Arsenophonus sp.]|nr:MAG: lipoyl(octanoyl) transferase LipB [Arsenophonus sp.]